MNRALFAVLSLALTAPCPTHADEGKQDGLTPKTAVVIVAQTERDGPPKEVEWIQKNYPGCKILRLVTRPSTNSKVYDVIFIKTADGKKQQLYFEISSFYHKK